MTSLDPHNKHAFVSRPAYGQIGRYEWSLIGAPCPIIQSLAKDLAKHLSDKASMVFVDATHQDEAKSKPDLTLSIDKIDHHALLFDHVKNKFDQKILTQDLDITLVNGNHFKADRQIVIINKSKKDSLHRKLERLTDVRMILLDKGERDVHSFLHESMDLSSTPILSIEETSKIAQIILHDWKLSKKRINGLVLAGGKSQRMGEDKAFIKYHGQDQWQFVATQMENLVDQVYLSRRAGQPVLPGGPYEMLFDSFDKLGPFGAILSAFRKDPDSAWMVVACDQPLLMKKHLKHLIELRDISKVATCYHNPATDFPEPLITIWEPKAYPRMLHFLSLGYSCPRKVLINSDIHLVRVEDTLFMRNANTKEEKLELEKLIQT